MSERHRHQWAADIFTVSSDGIAGTVKLWLRVNREGRPEHDRIVIATLTPNEAEHLAGTLGRHAATVRPA